MNKITIRCPLSVIRSKGITLMECLASIFVISIGLLGVLAVIPYGSFQIAKAKNSEHTAWMLAGAVDDLKTFGLAKPENWNMTSIDCTKIAFFDAFDTSTSIPLSPHINRYNPNNTSVLNTFPRLKEMMTGQDDLVYTIYPEGRRPDFVGQDGYCRSSGKYTWFFTCRPESYINNTNNVPLDELNNTANVDLVGCYNRVPGTEQIISITIPPKSILNGMMVELPSMPANVEMKKTKYVFLSWENSNNSNKVEGAWYKVVNVLNEASTPSLVLTSTGGTKCDIQNCTNLRILFIEGTIYHKRTPQRIFLR